VVREHPDLGYALASHPLVHRFEERAPDSTAAPVAPDADLVEEQLALVASPAALDVAQEVPDDGAVLLVDPVQDARIGQVRRGRVVRESAARAAASRQVEGRVLPVELGEERLVARAEPANVGRDQPVRRRLTCGACWPRAA
jgi:hypothetical protein